MNRTLHYDVIDIQVSHNSDGTLHIVFTMPDHLAQLPCGDERTSCTSSDPTQLSRNASKRVKRTNTNSLKTVNILGDLIFIEPLSEREQEVLEVLAQGASNQEIARALTIAPNTVKRHVRAILTKLAVSNRTQAVTRALHLELLRKKSLEAS